MIVPQIVLILGYKGGREGGCEEAGTLLKHSYYTQIYIHPHTQTHTHTPSTPSILDKNRPCPFKGRK